MICIGHRPSLESDEGFSVAAAELIDCVYSCRGSRLVGNVLVQPYVERAQHIRSISKIADLIRQNLISSLHDMIAPSLATPRKYFSAKPT